MNKIVILIFTLLVTASCATMPQETTTHSTEIAIAEMEFGESLYLSGKYTTALKKFLKAQEVIPDNPYLQNNLGLVYMVKRRFDLSERHFKKALAIKPDYVVAKNNLGAAYLRQKKWDLAIDCFSQISEDLLYGTPENPLANLGWAYRGKREYTKAKEYFLEALEIRPDFLIASHGLATTYIEMGQGYNAIRFLEKKIKRYPEAAILYSDIAKAYESVNENQKARQSWQKVLELVPQDSPLAREAEEKLQI